MTASFKYRGVVYSARVMNEGLLELAVNGRAIATTEFAISIFGFVKLGGKAEDAKAIYEGLAKELCKALAKGVIIPKGTDNE